MEFIESYLQTIHALGAMALLMIVQVLIADVLGIRSKHTPGAQVNTDHTDPLFRASRVVANTNETVAIFILGVLFCLFCTASPTYTAWVFVLSRVLYALFYYGNFQLLRSVTFGFSLVALISLLVIGFVT